MLIRTDMASRSESVTRRFCPLVIYHDDPVSQTTIPMQHHRLMIDRHRIKTEEMLKHNAQIWVQNKPGELLDNAGNNDIHVSPSTSTSSSSSSASSNVTCPNSYDGADHRTFMAHPLSQTSPSSPVPSLLFPTAQTVVTTSPRLAVHDLLIPDYQRQQGSQHPSPTHYATSNIPTAPDTVKKRRRGNLPKDVTEFLKSWLVDHRRHPYPSEKEKAQLAAQTSLTVNQISNWFINARRRILQPMLESESINAHLMAYSEMASIEQKRRRQLDIYAYQGFSETHHDDSRKWAFRRTRLPPFDLGDSNGYSFDMR